MFPTVLKRGSEEMRKKQENKTFAYPKAIYEARKNFILKRKTRNKICFSAINSPCFMYECNTELFTVSHDPKFLLLRLCQLDAQVRKTFLKCPMLDALDFHGEKNNYMEASSNCPATQLLKRSHDFCNLSSRHFHFVSRFIHFDRFRPNVNLARKNPNLTSLIFAI
jgi:hypothetical protein